MTHRPVRGAGALRPGDLIRSTEVDALVNTHDHHVVRHVRKTLIRFRRRGRRTGYRERRLIAEEVLERSRHRACEVVGTRTEFRIWRRSEIGQPTRITNGF